jgi:hypothetical protein
MLYGRKSKDDALPETGPKKPQLYYCWTDKGIFFRKVNTLPSCRALFFCKLYAIRKDKVY